MLRRSRRVHIFYLKFKNNAPHKKCLRGKTTVCVSLFVFFIIRRSISPYSGGDDANTSSAAQAKHTFEIQYLKKLIVGCTTGRRVLDVFVPGRLFSRV